MEDQLTKQLITQKVLLPSWIMAFPQMECIDKDNSRTPISMQQAQPRLDNILEEFCTARSVIKFQSMSTSATAQTIPCYRSLCAPRISGVYWISWFKLSVYIACGPVQAAPASTVHTGQTTGNSCDWGKGKRKDKPQPSEVPQTTQK